MVVSDNELVARPRVRSLPSGSQAETNQRTNDDDDTTRTHGRTDVPTRRRTDTPTDGRTDGRTSDDRRTTQRGVAMAWQWRGWQWHVTRDKDLQCRTPHFAMTFLDGRTDIDDNTTTTNDDDDDDNNTAIATQTFARHDDAARDTYVVTM